MLVQGFRFMLVGMGVVFVFLGIMVLVMYGMARVIAIYNRKYPEQQIDKLNKVISKNDVIAVAIAAAKAFAKS